MDIVNIAQGFINATRAEVGLANPMTEEIAFEKYLICLGCLVISDSQARCDAHKESHVVKDFYYIVKDEYRKKGQVVTGCNCLLALKTRSDSQCPLGKW